MQINLIFLDKSHIFFIKKEKKLFLLNINCENKKIKSFSQNFFLEFSGYKKKNIREIKIIKYNTQTYVFFSLINCKKIFNHKKVNFNNLLNYKLPMVILNNILLISKLIKKPKILTILENKIIKKLYLIKKNLRVYYCKKYPNLIRNDYLFLLKEIGLYYKQKIIRICMHLSDQEKYHEMMIIHCVPQKVGPLRQNKKSISFHIVYGKLKIYLHKYKLKIMLDKDNNSSTRLPANIYRTVNSKDEFCIFLEVAEGPFKDSDTIWKRYLA
jgi:cupin fold WbuC family metalloprotein